MGDFFGFNEVQRTLTYHDRKKMIKRTGADAKTEPSKARQRRPKRGKARQSKAQQSKTKQSKAKHG